ncbi:MAG: YeeE/YedE family protein [Yoonia sp.]|uniref:YeeE/YedE family protein n=1 Tax=Yoonia sp. TaxID=2212373 RepID=UPI003267DC1F
MLDAWGDANMAAVVGLFGGVLLGLAARLGRFCTLGAIEDVLYGGNDSRLRIWIAAIGFAIIGSFGLMATDLFDPAASFYVGQTWSPVASIAGGLLFGYGMALAGNCGFTALARLGGGDLRSFVIVVVMGLAAFATLSGPLAWIRVYLFPTPETAATPNGIAHLIGTATGISIPLIGTIIGVAAVAFALSNRAFRTDRMNTFWSIVIALAVVSAWAGMSFINRTGFDDLAIVSHTFSVPIGETMLYGMTASGQSLSFGIGSVVGVWVGAFIGSLMKGHFRWEACEDPRELRRQIFGATMMGVGAVVAIGCSIGQGLSAFSILSFSAPVTFAAIFAGAALGLRQLIVGLSAA